MRGTSAASSSRTYDERRLNVVHQEECSEGRTSTFFRLENPDREGA